MSEQQRPRVSPADPATWPLGLKLKFLLWERGLQQRHLARVLDVSEGLVSRILAGERPLTEEQLRRVRRWAKGSELHEQLVEKHVDSDQAGSRPSRRRKDIAA